MQLDFLPSGPSECPLIRLHDFTGDEAHKLWVVFDGLASGKLEAVALESLSFIQPVGGCRLLAQVVEHDKTIAVEGNPPSFTWDQSNAGWEEVRDKVEPFRTGTVPRGFNWLTNDLGVSILISASGMW